MNNSLKDSRINKAVALFTSGKLKDCLTITLKLIKIYPTEPFLFNLSGVVNAAMHNYQKAIQNYKKALSLNSGYIEVYNNIGVAYKEWGKAEIALKYLNEAIRLNPSYSEAYNNLGNAQKDLSQLDEAIDNYSKAIDLNPSYVDAMCNKGISLALQEKYEKSLELYKNAMALSPENLDIKYYISDTYFNLGEYKKAESFVKSLKNDSALGSSFFNLIGRILQKTGSSLALKYYKKALIGSAKDTDPLNNIGTLLFDKKKLGFSIKFFRESIRLDSTNYRAKLNLANSLLTIQNFKEGWSNYEYRWKVSPLVNAIWPIKGKDIWHGEKDKDVVLWREQGIGDDIIFLGLTPEARDRTKRLRVYVDTRLVVLCERSIKGVEFFPYKSVIEDVMECHLPMGSLPSLFRQTEDDFKSTKKGYLKADPERVSAIRTELGLEGKKVIGISWKSIKSLNTLKKSLTLLEFGKIFEGLDVTLINLQYGDVDKEIREFEEETGIKIVQCGSVDNREDLDGLAAMIEVCDLVVSTSNVTIHLAGALGKNTWVLLPFVSSFWWLLDRDDSVWYPSLKIYRQKKFGDWKLALGLLRNDICIKYS